LTATIRSPIPEPCGRARYVVAPDPDALEDLLRRECFDSIIHLAQPKLLANDPVNNLKNVFNEGALFSVILKEALAFGLSHLFVASTGGLYANCTGPLTVTSPLLQPPNLDSYYSSKLVLEAMASPHFGDLNITIGRIFFVYGPDQDGSKLVSRLIDSVRSGRAVKVSSSGGVKINPIFVDDAARAIHSCISLDGSRVLNVAGPEASSIRDVTLRIGRRLGIEPVFELDGLDRNLVSDISNLTSIVGDDLIGLDEGLRRTISVVGK
jgi:nucleoside-diphosphate-sugar epimerase